MRPSTESQVGFSRPISRVVDGPPRCSTRPIGDFIVIESRGFGSVTYVPVIVLYPFVRHFSFESFGNTIPQHSSWLYCKCIAANVINRQSESNIYGLFPLQVKLRKPVNEIYRNSLKTSGLGKRHSCQRFFAAVLSVHPLELGVAKRLHAYA